MKKNTATGSIAALTLIFAFLAVPFTAAHAAPYTKENAAWNINVNPNGSDPARYYGSWPKHQYTPSPSDWRKLAVYHVMLDRFSDGNPANNEGKYGGYFPGRFDSRHGGDFLGLMSKLDYIKSLGFDVVLISPIFQNLENEYHGYGQIDFTLLDDRLGTLEDFRQLIDAAHSRGMYIVVDSVVNHLSWLLYNEGYSDKLAPFHFHSGEYRLLRRGENVAYADFHENNDWDPDSKYCDVYGYDGEKYVDPGSGSFAKSDFHHNGDLTDYYDAWNVHLGQLYGRYNDLRLCKPQVQDSIIAMTKALLSSTDIDGIRIDTPMEVPLSFLKKWTPAVKQHAAELGKNNFFMFGELYTSRERVATMIGRGRTPAQYGKDEFISDSRAMDAGIDYRFYKLLAKPLHAGSTYSYATAAQSLLEEERRLYDFWNQQSGKSENRMLNFFDSHDQRRLASFPDGFKKALAATVLTAFWPGIPLYYYGDEQGFSSFGTALDGHAREDMMTSIAWRYHPAVEMPNRASLDNFDMTNPRYVETRRVFSARKQYSDLLTDDAIEVLTEKEVGSPALLAFSRGSGKSKLWVIINFSSAPLPVHFPATTFTDDGDSEFRDILHPGETFRVRDLALSGLSLPPWGARILVPDEISLAEDFSVAGMIPAHDSTLAVETPTRVTLTFNRPVRQTALCAALVIEGGKADCAREAEREGGRVHSIEVTPHPGILRLGLSAGLKSADGATLSPAFHARFRAGGSTNVLVSSEARGNALLIDGGAPMTYAPSVTLSHHAAGAKWFRVLNIGEKFWGPWEPYRDNSKWQLSRGGGWKEIAVQYWVDGSASYFAQSGIDYVQSDGINITDD